MHTLAQLRNGDLAGCKRLTLACDLTEFPSEIFSLADSLEILDLSNNQLSSLPNDLSRLHQLRVIFCSNNLFTELPKVLGSCAQLSMVGFKANQIHTVPPEALPAQLRWLILTDNCIEALPPQLGQCHQLQKLMLSGNRLHTLPQSLVNCRRLELLRIAANQLTELPEWLLTLPRLCWLAYAGNPFVESLEQQALSGMVVDEINWLDLSLLQPLGQGASGIIHLADRRTPDGRRHRVAVKLFKGAITSDGLPSSEMAACLGAATHPNLIPVWGKIKGHPEMTHGLIMDLIGPEFVNLAAPPSLESCTRDVYAPGTNFKPEEALNIAYSIASAARHLHERGIMHGDLYAHNILYCGLNKAKMGDFGAASFYETSAIPTAAALERLEVRAFGCLLEELYERTNQTLMAEEIRRPIAHLMAACLCEITTTRPLFSEIECSLADLLFNLRGHIAGQGNATSIDCIGATNG